jgi:hypothetical protein
MPLLLKAIIFYDFMDFPYPFLLSLRFGVYGQMSESKLVILQY